MHAYYFSVLATLMNKLGISEGELLANTGISAAAISKTLTLSAAQLDAVCTNALELSRDRQLGLKLGSRINIASQGIFGYALMTSATVGDALKLLLRYNRAILPGIHIELLLNDGRLEVLVNASHLPNELERFYCEVLYAAMIFSGSILIGSQSTSFMLELDYQAPYEADQYHQIFGSSIRFNSPRRVLSFEEDSLSIAISTANPVAEDIFRRECDRLSRRDSHRGMVSERVRQVLLQAGSEFPTSAAVARQLNMSESTLQRRLAGEGCRFQQLLDQLRHRLANEYLLGTTLPVSEIACLLGFSDATNFRRSFKRWSNTTPSMVRKDGASDQLV